MMPTMTIAELRRVLARMQQIVAQATDETPIFAEMEDGEIRTLGIPALATVDGAPAVVIYAGCPHEREDNDNGDDD